MTPSRFFRIASQRLRSLFRKERLDRELDEELSFHLEQLEKENLDAGMSPAEARRAARRTLGNTALFRDECRDERRVSWFYDFCQDTRYGLRMIRKHPGFALIATIALALGIGGNAAILGIGKALLWGELSLPDSDRLVVIQTFPDRNPAQRGPVSIPEYLGWKARNRTFEAIGTSLANQQTLPAEKIGLPPERLAGQAVTPSLFEVLKVRPQIGRTFLDDEAQVGVPVPPLIILSDRLWKRRFGGDPAILGKEIPFDGRPLKAIGVMPPDFFYPNQASEYWVPFAPNRFQAQGSARLFTVTARLKAGITVEQAQTDLNGIAAELRRDLPNHLSGWNAGIVPLREFWFGWSRGPLVMLESGLILVLLIACANVSTLLLARLPARQAEITMRVLLGAGRGRIVRQFLTESLLLSLMAGALGVLIAWWSVSSLEAIPPPVARMPISVLTQTTSISGLAVVLSLISSLMFGLLPALVAFSSGSDVRQANVHRRSGNLSGILVSTQVGLALVLLVSSGLLINSFVRLVLDDRGFDPKNILTFEYRIPVKDYVRNLGSFRGLPASDAAPPTEAIQRVHERLKTLPGIESVGGSSVRPVNGLTVPRAVVLADGKPLPASTSERENATVFYFLVTDNFFDTLKARIARGRDFSATDTRGAPWVAVINETMANHFWPGEDPIGKRFTIDAAAGEQPREVIGVVRDVALQYIRTGPAQPAAYTPYLQQPDHYRGQNANMFGQMTFFIRSPHEPSVVASAAREAVEEVDPRQPRATVQMLTDFLGGGIRTRGFYASALGVFALMATLMAAFGVYGVMSSSVSQRKREIGIHMAMGASARDIVRIVGGRAARLVAIGLFFGFLGSLVLAQSLRADVWGITSTDPATFAVVILFLTLVSSVACFIPARRAMRVDPTEALRVD